MYLSIAAFPQNTQQLKAFRTYALSALIHTVLGDLNLLAVIHVTGMRLEGARHFDSIFSFGIISQKCETTDIWSNYVTNVLCSYWILNILSWHAQIKIWQSDWAKQWNNNRTLYFKLFITINLLINNKINDTHNSKPLRWSMMSLICTLRNNTVN